MTEDGDVYYFNLDSSESLWDLPAFLKVPLDPQPEEENEDDNPARRSLVYEPSEGGGLEGGIGGEGSVFSEGGLLDEVAGDDERVDIGGEELAIPPRGSQSQSQTRYQDTDNNKNKDSNQNQSQSQGYVRPSRVGDQSWVSAGGYDSQEDSLEGTRYVTG